MTISLYSVLWCDCSAFDLVDFGDLHPFSKRNCGVLLASKLINICNAFFLHSSGTGGRMLIKIPVLVVLPLSIRTISFCLTVSSNVVF